MPNYSTDGTENMRADANVYAAAGDKSPSGAGKDAGGDSTNATVYSGGSKSTPGMNTSTPSGVQTFDGEAT